MSFKPQQWSHSVVILCGLALFCSQAPHAVTTVIIVVSQEDQCELYISGLNSHPNKLASILYLTPLFMLKCQKSFFFFFPRGSVFYKHFGRSRTGCHEGSTCYQTHCVLWTWWVQSTWALSASVFWCPFSNIQSYGMWRHINIILKEGLEITWGACGLHCDGQWPGPRLNSQFLIMSLVMCHTDKVHPIQPMEIFLLIWVCHSKQLKWM